MRSMHLDEARIGVRLAREAIEIAVNSGDRIKASQDLPAIFDELGGVFVTLHSEALRGCVGYPYASKTIKDALIDSAISAALYDHRFPPVRAEELTRIRVEITLLTKPKRIDDPTAVSYTHLRAHETVLDLVCRLLLEKKKKK